MNTPRKHLLFVITRGGVWGGAQKYVHDLAVHAQKRFRVSVAIGEPYGAQDLQNKLAARGIDVIQLRHLVRRISPIHDIAAIFELGKIYRTLKPDIIHLNSSKAGVLGSLAPRGNARAVYTAHGWVFNEDLPLWKKNLYIMLEKYTARRKDRIITLSAKDAQKAVIAHSIPKQKISIIPLQIEDAPALIPKNKARSFLGIPQEAFVIGTISNHYANKGIDILIESIPSVKAAIPNLHVSIIGDGPERQRLQHIISILNLEHTVTLHGFIENACSYLAAYDIYAVGSRKEGTPFALLEAQRAGIPTVATCVGGIPTLIQNRADGILVNPNNPQEFAKGLLSVYENYGTYKKTAENNRRTCRTGAMTQATDAIYYDLLLPYPNPSSTQK